LLRKSVLYNGQYEWVHWFAVPNERHLLYVVGY